MMMGIHCEMIRKSLLSTKFYIPPRRSGLVTRSHLTSRLNDGLVPAKRLILLSAPTGYGKTTLLTEWISQLESNFHFSSGDGSPNSESNFLKIAWLSIDESDNDVLHFLTYLVAAFHCIDERIGAAADTLLQTPSSSSVSYEVIIRSLINDLAEYQGIIILILDDYYLVNIQEIHKLINYLLDHLPEQVHIVIATRSDPPLSLARRRARNQMVEIRQVELRFSKQETESFLNQVMQLNLSPHDINALELRTEGWAAGLHLVALNLQGRTDHSDFIHAFSGSSRYILEYLIEEVFNRQTESVQYFLLATSILDRMTAPLCDVITGLNDSQMMLEMLEGGNLFIYPLDQNRQWYRYHRLFVEFLNNRLRHTNVMEPSQLFNIDIDVAVLHQRASQWFEKQGDIEDAIKHSIEAEDYERAADIIEKNAQKFILTEESHSFLHFFRALPETLIYRRPRLCLTYAWYMFITGQVEVVKRLLQHVKGSIPADDFDIHAEIDAIRTIVDVLNGDVPGSIQVARKALEIIPDDNLNMRAMILFNLGMAYDMQGDVQSATEIYRDAYNVSNETNLIVIQLLSQVQLADLKVLQGCLLDAEALYLNSIENASERGRRLPLTSIIYAGIGKLYYEWNDLVKAEQYLKECIELSLQWESTDMRAIGSIYLALVKMAQGDDESAFDYVKKSDEAIQGDLLSMPTANVTRAFSTRLCLMAGDIKKASQWQSEYQREREKSAINQVHIEDATLARIYLAINAPNEAMRLLEKQIKYSEKAGMLNNVIEDLVLQSLALELQGKSSQAVILLFRALSMAESEKYCRIFIDEGALMLALLQKAKAQDMLPAYIEHLISQFPEEMREGHLHHHTANGLFDSLSEREIEVLRLISKGLSNAEIAKKLYLSHSTVKTHVNNLYHKLGVNSRVQAVIRSREIGL